MNGIKVNLQLFFISLLFSQYLIFTTFITSSENLYSADPALIFQNEEEDPHLLTVTTRRINFLKHSVIKLHKKGTETKIVAEASSKELADYIFNKIENNQPSVVDETLGIDLMYYTIIKSLTYVIPSFQSEIKESVRFASAFVFSNFASDFGSMVADLKNMLRKPRLINRSTTISFFIRHQDPLFKMFDKLYLRSELKKRLGVTKIDADTRTLGRILVKLVSGLSNRPAVSNAKDIVSMAYNNLVNLTMGQDGPTRCQYDRIEEAVGSIHDKYNLQQLTRFFESKGQNYYIVYLLIHALISNQPLALIGSIGLLHQFESPNTPFKLMAKDKIIAGLRNAQISIKKNLGKYD